MAKVRVVLHDAGYRQMMHAPGVRADLQARADRIARATGPTMEPGVDMVAGVDDHPDRLVAYVVTASPRAMRGEAKDRRLTRAIDAGR